MSRWLANVEAPQENLKPLPDTPTEGDKSPPPVVFQTFCPLLSGCRVEVEEKITAPDLTAFDERAGIAQHDGGLSKDDAENAAAQSQGYANVIAFKAAQRGAK